MKPVPANRVRGGADSGEAAVAGVAAPVAEAAGRAVAAAIAGANLAGNSRILTPAASTLPAFRFSGRREPDRGPVAKYFRNSLHNLRSIVADTDYAVRSHLSRMLKH